MYVGARVRPALAGAVGFAVGALAAMVAARSTPAMPVDPPGMYTPDLSGLDVGARRAELLASIWPTEGFPWNIPDVSGDSIVTDVAGVVTAARVHPGGPRALIYHRGHGGDEESAERAVAFFRRAGFTVVDMAMPLIPPNPRPTLDIPAVGRLHMWHHDLLALVPGVHPLRFFLEPVARVVAYLEAQGHDDITMVGLSGGGWTVTVYAAVDPRIDRSYPVAGSQPVPAWRGWGRDMEQMHPDLMQAGGYAALYVMGAKGRRQVQVLNARDPCCFTGAPIYEAEVARRSGGAFEVWTDSTHRQHVVSDWALARILEDMGE